MTSLDIAGPEPTTVSVSPAARSPQEPARPWDRRTLLAVATLGVVLFVATLFYAFVLPLTPNRIDRPSAGLTDVSPLWTWLAGLPWPVPTDPATIAIGILVFGALSVGAYALAVALTWRRAATRRAVAVVLVPAACILVASAVALPTQSSDIVDYLLSGRVGAVYGESPYLVPPDAFPDDPLRPYASGNYTSDIEAKPPVWIAWAVGTAALTAALGPAEMVLVARLLFLALTLLNIGLIAAVLVRWRPEHLATGLVLFAWSPIVAMHGPFRFDTLMVTFALLGALLLVYGRYSAAMGALTLSVLVKLLTLPMLAVSVLGDLVARRWRQVVVTGLIAVGITLLVYLPFDGGATRVMEHLGFGSSVGGTYPPSLRYLFLGLAVLAVLWGGFHARGEVEGTLQGWALVGLASIPLAPLGWAWYVLVPIAVVSLSGEGRKTALLVAMSSVAFVADTWVRTDSDRYPLPVPLGLSRTEAVILAVVAVAILATAVAIVQRVRSQAASRATATAAAAIEGSQTG